MNLNEIVQNIRELKSPENESFTVITAIVRQTLHLLCSLYLFKARKHAHRQKGAQPVSGKKVTSAQYRMPVVRVWVCVCVRACVYV